MTRGHRFLAVRKFCFLIFLILSLLEFNLLWASSLPQTTGAMSQASRSQDYEKIQLITSNPYYCNELRESGRDANLIFDCSIDTAQIRIDKNKLNGTDYVTAVRQALRDFSTIEVWGDDNNLEVIYLMGGMARGLSADRDTMISHIQDQKPEALASAKLTLSNRDFYQIRSLSKDSPFPSDLFLNPKFKKMLENAQILKPVDWMDGKKRSRVLRYVDMMQKINKVKR
jgi:hypothetical protein